MAQSKKVSFSVWSSAQKIHDDGQSKKKQTIRRERTKTDDGITHRSTGRYKENGDPFIEQLSKKRIKENMKRTPKYVHWFRTYINGRLEDVFPTRNEERFTLDGVFFDI